MILLSLILAVVLAHFFPFEARKVLAPFQRWLFNRFETGHRRDAFLPWLVAVFPALLLFALSFWVAHRALWVYLVFNVVFLWFSLDFYPRRRLYAAIIADLNGGQIESAKQNYKKWRALDGADDEKTAHFDAPKIGQESLNCGFVDSHRHFFAPLYFFLIFGAGGALFYRIAESLSQKIEEFDESDSPFWRFGQTIFACLDWLPSRLTALGYAIMGHFEGAMVEMKKLRQGSAIAQNTAFLAECGVAALALTPIDKTFQTPANALLHGESLVDRIFGLWIFVCTLLFLFEMAGRFFVV